MRDRHGKSILSLLWAKELIHAGKNVYMLTSDVNSSFSRLEKFGLTGEQKGDYIKLSIKENNK